MPYDDIIEKHARRVGIDPAMMKTIMRVESSGRAGEQTGSYKGLFQLSDQEFKAHGGSGSAFDPEQNTMAAANKLARESLAFKEKYGREPKLIDIYMTHQQGEGGYQAHMSNPDAPAWKNMYYTAEGQQKGQAWAKEAIWGNLPASVKHRVGSKENIDQVTSKDFITAWDDSIKGGGAEFTATGEPRTPRQMAELRKGKGTLMGIEEEEPGVYKAPEIGMRVPQLVPDLEPIGRRGIV